jgi:predicted polyphosphate/ATP-dependent NAD kinase
MFKLGLIINPLAGIGGSVALKGSDGAATVEEAFLRGAVKKSAQRCEVALSELIAYQSSISIITASGEMGEDSAKALGFSTQIVYFPKSNDGSNSSNTLPEDTQHLAAKLKEENVDLILFVGGDGTARDVCSIIGDTCPVLGVPAGCKIHSGVYAITPKAAGETIAMMLDGQFVDIRTHDVRDIDEEAFRNNIVKAKLYGEMRVPQAGQFLQAVKQGGVEVEELVVADIAADIVNNMIDDVVYFIGSGKTTLAIMNELNLNNTLLGVDAVLNHKLIQQDLTAKDIAALMNDYSSKIVVSVIGGQGHIFGRGNQQFTADIIEAVGRDNIIIISTKAKLANLEGRALISDTGSARVDSLLAGFMEVTTGYEDRVLYAVK